MEHYYDLTASIAEATESSDSGSKETLGSLSSDGKIYKEKQLSEQEKQELRY